MHNPKDNAKFGRQMAETIAAQALAWLAGDPQTLNGFLALSGLSPGELMAQAADARLLGAVLDFILTEDRLVIGFCDSAALAYTVPQMARAALPGGEIYHWT
ncbi:MAG: DUF3572 domain-containing protein [Pseudomonadota bacterium]